MGGNSLDDTKIIRVLLNQIKALIESIQEILTNKDTAEHCRYVSYRDMALVYNDLAEQVEKVLRLPSIIYTFNVEDIRGFGDTLWGTQKRILEQVLVNSRMLQSSLEGSIDFVDDEFDNLHNFIYSRLRTVIFKLPEKELEVQNAIETLLLGKGLNKGSDYERESGKFMFSGREYIPDFIIPKLNLCIEVKLLREGRKSKVIEEISADITAYSKVYTHQLFIVYDLGVIQNEVEFRRDIENSGLSKVVIIKH